MSTFSTSPNTPRNRGDDTAPHVNPVTPAEDARSIMLNRVSWGAVMAGVVVALVTHLILNLLGIGVGAATLDPGAGDTPSATGFSIAAGVWWTVAGILASLAGGYTAGRLAGKPKESTAGWHGLTSWALTTLIIFYLLTSAIGGILGGVYNTVSGAVGNVAQAAGGAVQAAAPSLAQAADPFSAIENQIRSASGGQDPAALRDTAIQALRAVFTGNQSEVNDARERAAQALAQAEQVPIEQARSQIQQYEQQYRQTLDQAKQQATEAADTAATAVSTGALVSAVSLILGAIAAWFGGRWGTVEPTITADPTRSTTRLRT